MRAWLAQTMQETGEFESMVTKDASEAFKITTSASQVCAERVNGPKSWGMNLQLACAFKNIPTYQANFLTQLATTLPPLREQRFHRWEGFIL